MKPSQKGRACQASYQPAHLTEPPSESIILITRLTMHSLIHVVNIKD